MHPLGLCKKRSWKRFQCRKELGPKDNKTQPKQYQTLLHFGLLSRDFLSVGLTDKQSGTNTYKYKALSKLIL